MKSYLEDREQFVQFDESNSGMKLILKGIPQGSIHGPLLFLVYINDIPNSSNLLNFLMYADDTKNAKRAIRAISCAGYNAHTEPLFKMYVFLIR